MTQDSKESVLSRWSRRKLAAEQVEIAEPAVESQTDPEARSDNVQEAEQKPLLTDADMPPLETLTEDSDFSGFMSAGVSDELRNLALRKLFGAPVFNIRDGLDEYDEDYTTFEKLGDIVTCDMKHQIEMQELKKREAEQQAEAVIEEIEDEMVEDVDDEEMVEAEESPEDVEIVASAEQDNDPDQEKTNEQ